MGVLEQVTCGDGIVVLRLNRPERRNALNTELLSEMVDALERLSIDETLRVLVFSTTSERALCSGVDITEELDHAGGVERMRHFSRFLAALEAFPKPTIAVCVGNCIGGGAEIVAGCDLRIAGDNLKLAWAGARLGVPVGPARLTPLVGVARAKELIFTGRAIGAGEAAAIGLVHDSVLARDAEDAALRLAAHVAAHDAEGVHILKEMFRELDGAQGRVAHENELLEVFQRKGAGLPQGARPSSEAASQR
jgi:enoyl-CoA hydratase/carnithine racemase